jgi:hypothetical protein
MAMTDDIFETFDGLVKVEETYLGSQWKNKQFFV